LRFCQSFFCFFWLLIREPAVATLLTTLLRF